jgi:uncharacterized phage protein gp47/JayE
MSSYGVTDTGFNPKLIGDVLDDIETQQRADWGADINLGGEGVIGQNNATFAAAIAEAWEVLNAVYRSLYPDSASGEALDNVCAITGITRLPATRSTVTLECTGTTGTTLAAGRVISVDSTGERFVSQESATIGVGGTVDVLFQAENYGQIALNTGQSLTIETPVAGWSSVVANADAEPGEDIETDAALRLRRVQLLTVQGTATIEAIRADVSAADDVEAVYVFENVSLVTDSRNLPPKSIEVLAQGGTDTDVAQAIFDSKAAGIETYGHAPNDVTETVTDSMGIDHDINFTRPDETPVYIRADITYNPATYPSDGDDQIKAALAALGDTIELGQTVVYERFQAEVFAVSGVVDCPLFYIDDVSPPTGTSNLTFDIRELATFDTGDITVNSTPA